MVTRNVTRVKPSELESLGTRLERLFSTLSRARLRRSLF